MNGYVALAHRRTILGDGESEGLIPTIFSAAGSGIQNVLQMKKAAEDKQKSAADSASALEAVKAADQRAKDALAKAMVSEALKQPSTAADRLAADMALAAEDAAAAGLSPENQKKRADAARTALEKAAAEWQANAGNPDAARVKEMWVKAAQQVYAKTQNAMIAQAATVPGGVVRHAEEMHAEGGSWLTRKAVGPIPGWGVAAGGLAAIVAVVVLKKRAGF